MSDNSKIEWCEATWNPVTGCTKVSPGCDHCYAETFAERWRGTPGHHFENGFDVTLRPERLEQPFHWKRPRRVFVNSMSDLFHESVPDDYIARVFVVMAECRQHTFQVLTKRHGRMRSFLNRFIFRPPSNIWLGVSVEDQHWADIRIPALIETPAAVRFLSCEPLLGPVDLKLADERDGYLNWVIAGGESGPGARPMHPEWVRSLRDQCRTAAVPFFFKQWGAHRWVEHSAYDHATQCWVANGIEPQRVSKKLAGRELDGRTWDEYPHVAEAVPS